MTGATNKGAKYLHVPKINTAAARTFQFQRGGHSHVWSLSLNRVRKTVSFGEPSTGRLRYDAGPSRLFSFLPDPHAPPGGGARVGNGNSRVVCVVPVLPTLNGRG